MTIFGAYTVAELVDLLKAKDYQFAQVQKAIDDRHGVPVDSSFAADWETLKSRYATAKNIANATIAVANVTPGPNNLITADSQYRGVLTALKRNPDGQYQKGDMDDLVTRLKLAGNVVDESHTPQPSPDSDFEFNTLKTLDKLPGGGPPSKPWPMWKKGLAALGGLVGLGIVIKVAK